MVIQVLRALGVPSCCTKSIRYCIKCRNCCQTENKWKINQETNSLTYSRFYLKVSSDDPTKKRQKAHHTDSTEVSSSGFGRSPESNISSSNDHHSRLRVSALSVCIFRRQKSHRETSISLPYHYCRWDSKAEELFNSMEQLHRDWNTGFSTSR